MSEVAHVENELRTPDGQVIDLSDPAAVALAYDDVQQLKRMVGEVERTLKKSLAEHAAALGKKTFELEGIGRVEIKGGSEKRYDAQGLKRALKEAGMPPERIAEIVRETVELKVMGVEANKAAKANEKYAAIIEDHTTLEEKKSPTITVTKFGGGKRGVGARRAGELTAQDSDPPADDPLSERLPWE
jgi:hypothetical protein